MEKKKLRIVLADDHRVLRTGLKLLLSSQSDFCVVGEASDGKELLQYVAPQQFARLRDPLVAELAEKSAR